MEDNKYKNIFDAAGQIKKSMDPKVPASPEIIKQDPLSDLILTGSEELLNLHGDTEINAMLNKMYRMQQHIQTSLNQIYESAGLSTSQIKNFLNNPSNFPPDIWQKIQGQRDSLEKKIGEVLKVYAKQPKKGHIAKITSEESKERKSKTLGARKKWIPM